MLASEDGGTRLTYDCDQPEPQASTTAEAALIRQHSLLVTRHAARMQGLDSTAALADAYQRGDVPRLEAEVVRYICAHGNVEEPRKTQLVFPDSGSLAPDFELPLLSLAADEPVRQVRLSQYRGRVVLLDFWASWCTGCKQTHPAVVELARRHEKDGLVVLGVVYRDSPANARRHFAKSGRLPHAFVVDEHHSLRRPFQIDGIPRMFVIDREGKLAAQCVYCQRSNGELGARFLAGLRGALAAPGAEQIAAVDAGPGMLSAHAEGAAQPAPRR